jgi:hypothetical protein
MDVELVFRDLPGDGVPAFGHTYHGVAVCAGTTIGVCKLLDGLFVAYVGASTQFIGADPRQVKEAIADHLGTGILAKRGTGKVVDIAQRRWEQLARKKRDRS